MSRRILVRFKYPSGHLLGKRCSLGYPFVLFVLCYLVILAVSHLGFDVSTLFFIASLSL